jgi:hypothetical protein
VLHKLARWSGATLDTVASTRNLALALGHAAVATTVYTLFHYDVPRTSSWSEWPATFALTSGTLVVVLGLATLLSRAVANGWRRWLPRVTGHRWWWIAAAVAAAFAAVGASLQHGGGLLWIVGFLFLMTFVTLIGLRLTPWRTLADVDLLPDATAGAWTAVSIGELLFHTFGGSFFRWEGLGGLMTTMSDEVVAFVFGPAIGVTVLILAGYLAGAAGMSVVFRRRPVPDFAGTKGRSAILVALVVAAMGVALLSSPGSLLRRAHHAHPTVADVAGLFAPSMPSAGAVVPTQRPAATTHPASAQNLLIIYVDTLSRRHLEAYGYARPVAPNVAELARSSTRFTAARTNASHTDLATVALFYGIFPYLNAYKEDDYTKGHGGRPLHLLAADSGFKTGLFSGDWEQATRGYAPLFPAQCDAFMDAHTAGEPAEILRWAGLPEDKVVDAFLTWYAPLHERDERFIGYVKFIRPHSPYYTPPEWRGPFQPAAPEWTFLDYHPSPERAELVLNRYDNAIYWVDEQVGRLVADLKRTGAWDDTAIIFLSDHGEAWGEHVLYTHSMQHFEEFLEIPLLVRIPGTPPGDDARWASTVDVAPTALSVLGLPPAPFHQGHTLADDRYEPDSFLALSNITATLATLQLGPWKYTRDLQTGEQWLFHLVDDPGELRNVAWTSAETPRLRRALARRLASQLTQMETLRRTHPAEERGNHAAR